MTLTRQSALSAARFVYALLVERARAGAHDPDAVAAVYGAWRDKIDALMSFRTDPVLSDQTRRAVTGLMDAVMRTSNSDHDALLRWLDAYPSAVSELFPPSESTFSLQMEHSGVDGVLVASEHAEAGEFALVA